MLKKCIIYGHSRETPCEYTRLEVIYRMERELDLKIEAWVKVYDVFEWHKIQIY